MVLFRSGIAGAFAQSILNVLRTHHTVFHSSCTRPCSHQHKASSFSTSWLTLELPFLTKATLEGVRRCFTLLRPANMPFSRGPQARGQDLCKTGRVPALGWQSMVVYRLPPSVESNSAASITPSPPAPLPLQTLASLPSTSRGPAWHPPSSHKPQFALQIAKLFTNSRLLLHTQLICKTGN